MTVTFSDFLRESRACASSSIKLVTNRTGRIYAGTDADWGWYFWRADFSSCHRGGHFRADAQLGNVQGESVPFLIGRQLVLQETARNAVDFFYVQRCGFEVP